MLFSSMIFLWCFLPILLILYKVVEQRYKNWLLLIASIIFYGFGGPEYLVLVGISIVINYVSGLLIYGYSKYKKVVLLFCVFLNIGILGYFKYYNFVGGIINQLTFSELLPIKDIVLPIGISFYTFQALSYVIDLYRGEIKVQKKIENLALYILFFPQLIAGPIVRYADVEAQMENRSVDSLQVAYGIKRFIYGLSKKVIFSNTFAAAVDGMVNQGFLSMGILASTLWILMYALQIYFDFSGYSDMAIGLGRIFGFRFLENFNYPYIANSIQDFWHRWHISLSTWFREYVYIPLGGNRKGAIRTYINLFIVFFTTGLWHGASFAFVFWGLWHGVFSVLERLFLGKILKKNPIKIMNHLYVMTVVLIGWVFFRLASFTQSLRFLKNMFTFSQHDGLLIQEYLDLKTWFLLILGILGCGLIQTAIPKIKQILYDETRIYALEYIYLFFLMFINIMLLVSNTYNPFIYFRF